MSGGHSLLPRDGKILVVCTGNLCRSPFAEGYLRQVLGYADVCSAGTHAVPGNPVPEDGLLVARKFGVDLEAHRARRISLEELEEAAAILCMEPYHAAVVEPMAIPIGVERDRIIVLDIPDPYGQGQNAYKQSFTRITQTLSGQN